VPRRLAAWVIDVVVLTALIFAGASALAALLGPTIRFSPEAATLASTVTVDTSRVALSALVSTSLSGAYFVIPWVVLGASPGQLLLNIQVHGEAGGGALPPGRAIARWVLLLPPFGAVAALAVGAPSLSGLVWGSAPAWYLILLLTTVRSPMRQGLHDRIARSTVRPRAGENA